MSKRMKLCIVGCVAVAVIAVAVIIGSKLANIIYNPDYQGGLFATSTPRPTGGIVVELTPPQGSSNPGETPPAELPTDTPIPTPTIDPYQQLLEVADQTLLEQHIVNFLLIGVDYEQARIEDWNGKDGNSFHSDVMMVLAVNFDEGRADLISLPRDTYAIIPEVKGIYKLNASLNCGTDGKNYGLFAKNGEGFEKVCEAAEWMLGGIEVDYYYAVTMEAVKQLVDAFGGVWYDVEGDFDNGGRFYKKGYQFMDGQAALDYMRVRKDGHTTMAISDSARVNRQKNMMVAIYKSMKDNNLMGKIPEVLSAFNGMLYTNCTIEQTAALAAFGLRMNTDNIGMYSMSGSTTTIFHWNFCLTDQSNRVEIIEKVYGVKKSQYRKYSKSYAQYRWADMLYEHYMELCEPLTKYVQTLIDADNLLPEFSPSPSPSASPTATVAPTVAGTPQIVTTPAPTDTPVSATATPVGSSVTEGGANNSHSGVLSKGMSANGGLLFASATSIPLRQYSIEQRMLFDAYKLALEELEEIKKDCDNQASRYANGKSSSLTSVSTKYLEKLDEVQKLAIELALSFKYDVKYFTKPCAYNSTYVNNSVWGINYWDDKKFNEVRVNFN